MSALCPGPTAGETKPPHDAVVAPEEFRTLKPAFVSPGEHLPVPQRSDTTSQTSNDPGQHAFPDEHAAGDGTACQRRRRNLTAASSTSPERRCESPDIPPRSGSRRFAAVPGGGNRSAAAARQARRTRSRTRPDGRARVGALNGDGTSGGCQPYPRRSRSRTGAAGGPNVLASLGRRGEVLLHPR